MGALRISEAEIPATVHRALEQAVETGGGKVRRGETEVLAWTGEELQKAGANSIVDRLAEMAAAGGWKYEVSGVENGITFFTLLQGGSTRRAVFGFYGEADATLVVALTELHAVSNSPSVSQGTGSSTNGSVGDYVVEVPQGWSRSESAGNITLSKGEENTITFLPMMDSSGDLARDADRLLWQIFKGYEPWSGLGFERDYGIFEKGRTSQGLEYFWAYRYAKKVGDDGSIGGSRFDANILVVKVGSKVAVIVGRQPFQTIYSSDSASFAIDRILYDLRFKSVTTPYDLKPSLLGSWSASSGSVAVSYTFNANGSFHKGAASNFRTSHDATRDKVTTTSYGMTETYAVAGNVITQNYKRTRETFRYKIRAYETKYDKDEWQQKLGFLPVDDPASGTIVFQKTR